MVDLNEDQRKYLEMIQSGIARFSTNSFVLKGWTVALVTTVLGFAAQDAARAAVLALVPTVLFWVLDGYFLAQERAFRELFEQARKGQSETYAFPITGSELYEWWRAVRSVTVLLFHGTLALVALVTACLWR
jgi:hypothetical protein